jgi:LPS-assembly protein
MLKLLFLFLFTTLTLFANEKVKIYASSMQTLNNIITADDGITVLYEDYILTAQKAKYDKESGDLELFENIRVTKGSNYKILGKYAKLNIAKKERYFKPFYMLDRESELWLSADEGKTKVKDVDVNSGTLSGCDPIDPIWTIDFSSSDYNTESKWMNIYNARLYIGDIPVIFTPYFGYSLDTTRRTGLLLPQLGLSNQLMLIVVRVQ